MQMRQVDIEAVDAEALLTMDALEAVRESNSQTSSHRPAKYRLLTETLDCSSAVL
jgi:hypothetical protein